MKTPPTKRGLLIVIEGIDGTGKSTQARMLAESLRQQGEEVVLDREPSDGPYGRQLRESMTEGRLEPLAELELFHKDRKQHVNDVILPALERGVHVVLDRYYFSTMAYQGARGFNVMELRAENESFAPAPDLLLILDLNVELALERINARGDLANEFEKAETLQFCRGVFLSVNDEPYARVIDASGDLASVHHAILAEAKSLLHKRG